MYCSRKGDPISWGIWPVIFYGTNMRRLDLVISIQIYQVKSRHSANAFVICMDDPTERDIAKCPFSNDLSRRVPSRRCRLFNSRRGFGSIEIGDSESGIPNQLEISCRNYTDGTSEGSFVGGTIRLAKSRFKVEAVYAKRDGLRKLKILADVSIVIADVIGIGLNSIESRNCPLRLRGSPELA